MGAEAGGASPKATLGNSASGRRSVHRTSSRKVPEKSEVAPPPEKCWGALGRGVWGANAQLLSSLDGFKDCGSTINMRGENRAVKTTLGRYPAAEPQTACHLSSGPTVRKKYVTKPQPRAPNQGCTRWARRAGRGARQAAPARAAHPQAVVAQVRPGLLRLLLLQELVGLRAALAGLLRLRPGEAHLARRDMAASGLGRILRCPSPTRRPGPTSGAWPSPPGTRL